MNYCHKFHHVIINNLSLQASIKRTDQVIYSQTPTRE